MVAADASQQAGAAAAAPKRLGLWRTDRMPTLQQIADLLGLPAPRGAGDRTINGIAALEDAAPDELTILKSPAFLKDFAHTRAAAVIVEKTIDLASMNRARQNDVRSSDKNKAKTDPTAPQPPAHFFVDDAELALAKVMNAMAPPVPHPPPGIDPSARVAPDVQIGPDCAIGPFVHIGAGTRLGRHCLLHAGVVVGQNVLIGDDCVLFPNVVIRERVLLGNRVTIHAGSMIGSDGFGYRWDGKQHVKVPQIGTVHIEDDVEIGSCVCVDRAKFGVTRVGRGSKIDNLVQVAHNVTIGPNCIIVGQVGMAGSTKLGAGVVLGGQSALRDHIALGDGAMVAACAAVADDVDAGMTVSGVPALPHRQTLREQAALRRLPNLLVQVRDLEEKVRELSNRLKEQ
jgi:UDP-3-O-[3-hydroxymyristoyl] glucosamine N-acyltransferase